MTDSTLIYFCESTKKLLLFSKLDQSLLILKKSVSFITLNDAIKELENNKYDLISDVKL